MPSQANENWREAVMDQLGPTEDSTYLRPLTALALFDQSEKCVREGEGWIKVSDRWLQIGRTDLMDDVRTRMRWTRKELEDPESIIAYYRQKISWGARITRNGWYSIDARTDG